MSVKLPIAAVTIAVLIKTTVAVAQGEPLMFVSSAWGSVEFDSWPAASGQVGIAGADAICQSLAADASLESPANYRAWISDSADDAYCRVAGLAGKKSDNCGEPTLPDGGPWLRTDGFPFSGTLQQLTGGSMVLVPAVIDETGTDLVWDIAEETLTGTQEDGAWATDQDCQGWTDSQSGYRFRGRRSRTVKDWAAQGPSQCRRSGRLLCFEADSTPEQLPDFEQPGAIVFVTSVRRLGNLGAWPEANGKQGLEAGDEICRMLARSSGVYLPDSFVAWLSDSTVDARDRLNYPGPWKRLDGVPVAKDLADLTDGRIFTSISVTEKRDYVTGRAWTGTDHSGRSVGGMNCGNWSDESAFGHYGQANETSLHWTNYGGGSNTCANDPSRLYCFSEVTHVPGTFADGFESGDTAAWSGTVE